MISKLEFLATFKGQIYKRIEAIISENKGLVIKVKKEKDSYVFENDCFFFQTEDGIVVGENDRRNHTYFFEYSEIREIHRYEE